MGAHQLSVPGINAARWLEQEFANPELYTCSAKAPRRIVDCGANVGASASLFLQRFPTCHVVCVEPDPVTFDYLNKNLVQNGLSKRTTVVRGAVSDRRGEADFFASEPGQGYSLRMSLDEARMDGVGTKIKVPTIDVADLIVEGTDILKLDIEGAEYDVVGRLSRTGKLNEIGHILIEVHHYPSRIGRLSELLQVLEGTGFEIRFGTAGPFVGEQENSCQDILLIADRRGGG